MNTNTRQKALQLPGDFGRYVPLAAVILVMATVYALGWHRYLSFDQLALNQDAVLDLVRKHYFLVVGIYLVLYALVVALSLPVASFMTIFGGFAFGPLVGGTLTVVAATSGALAIFLIARSSLGEPLSRRAGPKLERLRAGFEDHALNYMLFLRLVPLFPFWLVNIAPALLGVRTTTYILGTLLGIVPATYAFSYVGAGLGSVIAAQGEAIEKCFKAAAAAHVEPACHVSLDPGSFATPELLIALAGLGVVALIPVAFKKFRNPR